MAAAEAIYEDEVTKSYWDVCGKVCTRGYLDRELTPDEALILKRAWFSGFAAGVTATILHPDFREKIEKEFNNGNI